MPDPLEWPEDLSSDSHDSADSDRHLTGAPWRLIGAGFAARMHLTGAYPEMHPAATNAAATDTNHDTEPETRKDN